MKKQDIKNGMLVKIKDGRLLYIVKNNAEEKFLGYDDNKYYSMAVINDYTYNDDLTLKEIFGTKYTITEIYSEIKNNATKGLFSTENRTLLWKEDDKNFKEYLIDTTDYNNLYNKYNNAILNNSICITPNYLKKGYKENEGKDIIVIDIADNRDVDDYNKSEYSICTSLTIEKTKELIKALTEIVEYVEGE